MAWTGWVYVYRMNAEPGTSNQWLQRDVYTPQASKKPPKRRVLPGGNKRARELATLSRARRS